MEYRKAYRYKSVDELWGAVTRAHIAFKDIRLNRVQLKVFSYFCQYGISKEIYDKILEDNIVKSYQEIYNIRTILKDNSLIKRIKNNSWEVEEPLKSLLFSDTVFFIVKLNGR